MKRLNDLLSGKENIKVKSIDSPIIDTKHLRGENGEFSIFLYSDKIHVYYEYAEKNWYFNNDGSFESEDEIKSYIVTAQAELKLPSYTSALRPTSQDEGSIIYDSTLKKCILYNGTAWVNLDGTALA